MAASFADVASQVGSRFTLVNALPATTLVLFSWLAVASGAVNEGASLANLQVALQSVRLAEVGLAVFGVFALMLVLNSFQTKMVKVLEGYWRPVGLRMLLMERGLRRHTLLRVRYGIDKTTQWSPSVWHELLRRLLPSYKHDEFDRRYRDWAAERVAFYPPAPTSEDLDSGESGEVRDRIMPTRLGNALRQAEDFAGNRFGLNAVIAVRYLLDVASDDTRSVVDDAQTEIDVTTKFVYVWAVCTTFSLVVFLDDGPWLLIPVVTGLLTYISYSASIAAAMEYGRAIIQLVDLYRFDMMIKLHWPLPRNLRGEIETNEKLWDRLAGKRDTLDDLRPYAHPPTHRTT